MNPEPPLQQPVLDVWAAHSCGLVTDELARLLETIVAGDAAQADSAYTRTGRAAYRPYESMAVPRNASGEVMASRVIDTVLSEEAAASVLRGPLAQWARASIVSVRSELWPGSRTPASAALSELARIAPRKGNEIPALMTAYRAAGVTDTADAVPMILRDFYASIFVWQFIRASDPDVHDLCGSVLCLTTAIDQVGAADAPGRASHDAYVRAAGEGVALLSGRAATQALRDIVVTDAFMRAKDRLDAECSHVEDPSALLAARGGPVTPQEFLDARWWDAALAPYHRLILATSGYRHLTDDLGTLLPARHCGRIKRAIDSIIRYDEIPDLLADFHHREPFNELLAALALGGCDSVAGYADAVGHCTDDVLACRCGADGHQETAEFAMASCLWYLLVPRYRLRQQLLAYTGPAAGPDTRAAFAWATPGGRLSTVADLTLAGGSLLHAPDWTPAWSMASCPGRPSPEPPRAWGGGQLEGASAVPHRRSGPGPNDMAGQVSPSPGQDRLALLARRAVDRALLPESGPEEVTGRARCEAAARRLLAACDALGSAEALSGLAPGWAHLFDTVVTTAFPALPEDVAASARELSGLTARIWDRAVVIPPGATGSADGRGPDTDGDEVLFIAVDRAMRRTYQLEPADGVPLRRAFLGVTTSAIELSGLNPYERLTTGTARLCRKADA